MSFGLRTAVGGEDFLLLPWPMPRCCERSRPMPRWGASPRASGEASERLGKTAGAACCRAGKIRLLEESGLAISCATFSLAPSSSSSSFFLLLLSIDHCQLCPLHLRLPHFLLLPAFLKSLDFAWLSEALDAQQLGCFYQGQQEVGWDCCLSCGINC